MINPVTIRGDSVLKARSGLWLLSSGYHRMFLLYIQVARDRTSLLVAELGHVEEEADQKYGHQQDVQGRVTSRRRGGVTAPREIYTEGIRERDYRQVRDTDGKTRSEIGVSIFGVTDYIEKMYADVQ